jgi:hypothetical protein
MSNGKKNHMPSMLLRQGDVLIELCELPTAAKLTEMPLDRGKVILAYGEATGHHHAFNRAAAVMFRDEADARYVRVAGTARKGDVARALEINGEIDRLFARADIPIETRKADIETIVAEAEADGFAALRHLGTDGRQADHKPIVLPPGATGRVRLPREYSPEEIRAVAD